MHPGRCFENNFRLAFEVVLLGSMVNQAMESESSVAREFVAMIEVLFLCCINKSSRQQIPFFGMFVAILLDVLVDIPIFNNVGEGCVCHDEQLQDSNIAKMEIPINRRLGILFSCCKYWRQKESKNVLLKQNLGFSLRLLVVPKKLIFC